VITFNKKGNNPLYAMQFFFTGLAWLGKAPLRPFLLIPILINIVLYSIAFVLGYLYLTPLVAQLIPAWLHWLSWLLTPLFFLCFAVLGFFTFTLFANLIAAPFYGKLAEKTHALILETQPTDDHTPVIAQPHWSKVMLGELQRLAYLIKWMVLLTVLSFIPVINLFAPLLWAAFGAWGCALEFFAYPLENKGLLFQEQRSLIKTVQFGAVSFGGMVMFSLSLPVFNLVVAPAAVIAATLYTHALGKS